MVFKDFSSGRITFQRFGVIIQACVNNAEIRQKTRAACIVSVFSEPFFGLRGDFYTFTVPRCIRKRYNVANAAAGRLLVLVQPFKLFDGAFIINE